MADQNKKRWFHFTRDEIILIVVGIVIIAAVICRLPGRQ